MKIPVSPQEFKHTLMSRIHVFDPLTGNTVRFYGNLITFDLIH